jgi:hypothetical protein
VASREALTVLILIARFYIMGNRRPLLSSFFAVVLVLLTASPLTAPFQTFDLSTPAGEAPADTGACGEKASKECALPAPIDEMVPVLHSLAPARTALETIPQHTPVTRTVLRL